MKKQGRFQLLLFLLVSMPAFSNAWPRPAVPASALLKVVAENMVVNGVPMRTWTLTSSVAAKDTLDFYRQLWGQDATENWPGYTERELNQWHIISRLENGHLITVQVNSDQPLSTNGLLGISKLPTTKSLPELGKGFPTLGQTTILNDIHATDLNKKSRTLVATSSRSMRSVIQFYRNTFEKQGWVEKTAAVPYSGEDEFALILDRSQQELSMTFSRQANKTALVAVYVEQ